MNLKTSLEQCLDESVIDRNNWFMYGSGKPDSEPYKLYLPPAERIRKLKDLLKRFFHNRLSETKENRLRNKLQEIYLVEIKEFAKNQ